MAFLDLANTRRERVTPDNPVEGDLFVDPATGDTLLLDGADTEVQAVTIRLRTFKGEWLEDEEVGLPWFQYILGNKKVSLSVVKGLVRAEILGRGTFRDVPSVDISLPDGDRKSNITFTAVTLEGTAIGPYTRGLI